MKNFNDQIGDNIAQVRKKMGIKQVDLARKINKPQAIISEYESGIKRIYPEVLIEIAKALGVSILELIPIDEENLDNKLLSRFKKIQSLNKDKKEDFIKTLDMLLNGIKS